MKAELVGLQHISYLCSLPRGRTMTNNTKQTPQFLMDILF